MGKVEIELEVLLQHPPEASTVAVKTLCERLGAVRGVSNVHAEEVSGKTALCIHYEPDVLPLAAIERRARDEGAVVSSRFREATIALEGMDCSDCVTVIEHGLKRVAGVLDARVSYPTKTARVAFDSKKVERADLEARIEGLGYRVPRDGVAQWARERMELIGTLLAGAFVAGGWVLERFAGASPWAYGPVYAVGFVLGGWEIALHAFHALRERRSDTDVLMLAAALGAAVLQDFAEGGLLLFLFSLGHALEEMALDRTRDAVRKLGSLTPRQALVRRDGAEKEVSVDEVLLDEVLIVRPGARLPVDGVVVVGTSAVDQAPITGESVPVEKRPGDKVFAGTVNGEGALEVRATRLAADSTLARVMTMVEETQGQKSRAQTAVEKFTRWFVPAVLVGVALVMVVPWAMGLPFRESFLRAMTMLVAASPCALALGAPSAMLSGIAQAARHGVLIKGGIHLEALGRLDALAFDKTGTLTVGRPQLTAVVAEPGWSEDRVLALAAALESRSGHPLAQAIVQGARARSVQVPSVGEVVSVTGQGLRSTMDGAFVLLGSASLLVSGAVPVPESLAGRVRDLQEVGATTMMLAVGGQAVGALAVADTIRPATADALRRLREVGVRELILLTGDNRRVGEHVGRQLALDSVQPDLMPEDKVRFVRELAAQRTVGMVGDGVNDAPALASASVGVAMGGAGTDVALETADVALMGDDLGKLPFAIGLGRAAKSIVVQNIAISLGVIGLLLVTSVMGLAGIGVAIVVHEGSTLLVVANSLRLLGYREQTSAGQLT